MSIRDSLRLAAHLQLMPVLESGEETLVGGQAVMEGVMMRTPHSYCVAVRQPDGNIVTEEAPLARVSERYPIFKLPVLRGIGTLGQAMWLGVKALKFSANAALGEGDGKGGLKKDEIPGWAMGLQLLFSFAFAFVVYKWIPLQITETLSNWYPALHGHVAFNALDGVLRLAIFVGFLALLSRSKDIKRVFEFHGAEHKVVFNFESGKPVTVENARRFQTWHPRCGTSFLLVVMLVSVIVYMAIPVEGYWMRLLSRFIMLPVIAGLSYEVIRFAARRQSSVLALMTVPGLWLQRITTQPPADEQTAVAIRALEGAMELEKQQGGPLVIA